MTDVIATTEATLCRIVAEVVGVDLVRPEDGFFEVGGDSVLAVQVVARAREAGLALVIRDLFDHQSPRELAAATGLLTETSTETASTDSGSLSEEFEDVDLADLENVALSQQAGDAERGWETFT